jgi:hypothetical protein
MTLTLTIPDAAVPDWEAMRINPYNAGSGQEPITLQQLKQLELDEETSRYKTAKADADAASLKPLAPIFLAASPEKQQQALAILQS